MTTNNKGVQTDASVIAHERASAAVESVKTAILGETPVIEVKTIEANVDGSFNWAKFNAPAGDYVGLYDAKTGALKKSLPEAYASPLGWLAVAAGSKWLNERGNPVLDKLGIRLASEKTVLVVRSISDTHKRLFIGTLAQAKKLADLADRKATLEAMFDAEVIASVGKEVYTHEDVNAVKGAPKTAAVKEDLGLDKLDL